MFRFIKKIFIGLLSFCRSLACVAKVSDCIKCESLNMFIFKYQPFQIRPTLTHVNSNELLYYPVVVSVNRCG